MSSLNAAFENGYRRRNPSSALLRKIDDHLLFALNVRFRNPGYARSRSEVGQTPGRCFGKGIPVNSKLYRST